MAMNPVVRPVVVTAGLVAASATVLILLVVTLTYIPAAGLPLSVKMLSVALPLAASLYLGWLWWRRAIRRRTWAVATAEQWRSFDIAKLAGGTTAELTLLSVDAVQPTGSWVTVAWNRFNHVQPAWLESLPEPIWPGSVLLISPDPAQVLPGAPWPDAYLIRAADCLAWAPAEGRPSTRRPSSSVRVRHPWVPS